MLKEDVVKKFMEHAIGKTKKYIDDKREGIPVDVSADAYIRLPFKFPYPSPV